MKDYTRYRLIFKVADWIHVAVHDSWLHDKHVFGLNNPLNDEIKQWLETHVQGHYAVLEDDESAEYTLAFSRDYDAVWFSLQWA